MTIVEKLPKNVITILPPLEKIQKPGNVAILGTEIVVKSKKNIILDVAAKSLLTKRLKNS